MNNSMPTDVIKLRQMFDDENIINKPIILNAREVMAIRSGLMLLDRYFDAVTEKLINVLTKNQLHSTSMDGISVNECFESFIDKRFSEVK